MNITVKKLAELHKPTHNIRRHSDKQITEYIRSIEMFGQVKPLVVAEDGELPATVCTKPCSAWVGKPATVM